MIDALILVLVILSLAFSIWYNYHHFKRLMGGDIDLVEITIAVGSIILTIILFIFAIFVKMF